MNLIITTNPKPVIDRQKIKRKKESQIEHRYLLITKGAREERKKEP